MPFIVPEGYFENFKASHKATAPRASAHPAHYLRYCAAAAVALFITAGTLFMGSHDNEDAFYEEDYIMTCSDMQLSVLHNLYDPVDDEKINENDIIEYLIFAGVSPEMIAMTE